MKNIHVTMLRSYRRHKTEIDINKIWKSVGHDFEIGQAFCSSLALRRMDKDHTIDWEMGFE